MGHLLIFIYQLFCLLFYLVCKIFDVPGLHVITLLSWIVPVGFYFVLSIVSLFQKHYKKALLYFLLVLLILCIPNKFWFIYHNIIFHFLILVSFVFAFYKAKKNVLPTFFKLFSYIIIGINGILLLMSDHFVNEKLISNPIFKPYSAGPIHWSDFRHKDSIEDHVAARIDVNIHYRTNRVYNFTSATAVARMNLEESYYVVQSDDLLKHEYYHFKITEIVTRKLNAALDQHHFASYDQTKGIIIQYLDTLYEMNRKYDTETNHSIHEDAQKAWEKRVDLELRN